MWLLITFLAITLPIVLLLAIGFWIDIGRRGTDKPQFDMIDFITNLFKSFKGPFSTLMQEERAITNDAIAQHNKWKTPIRVEYNDNVLTITTLDHNITQYRHSSDAHGLSVWKRYTSFVTIKDEAKIRDINILYKLCLNGKKTRSGWTRELR